MLRCLAALDWESSVQQVRFAFSHEADSRLLEQRKDSTWVLHVLRQEAKHEIAGSLTTFNEDNNGNG